MGITLGATGQGTSSTGATVAPSWSSTPYQGSLLVMEVVTNRTANPTYFGNGTNKDVNNNYAPVGWTCFGDNQQQSTANRSVAQYYKIAGASEPSSVTVGGYSDSGHTTLAGITAVTMIELRDGVSGSTCLGSWDLTNAMGIGIGVGATAPWSTSTSTGTTTTLTIGASSWSSAYVDTGLLVIGQAGAAGITGLSACDSTYGTTGYAILGIKATTSGSALSPVLTTSGTTNRGMAAYVIGFNPQITPTVTLSAGARLQTTPAKTLAAGGQIAAVAFYGTQTLSAGARIQGSATAPALAAGARVRTAPTSTLAAGGAIQGPWTPQILMGTGNVLAEALGSQYLVLSGDIDGGDASSHQAASPNPFTYVIDGGRSSD